jgi:hypothetical protein
LLGSTRAIDWTKTNSDDCFLTLDAALLETIGFTLEDESGAVLVGKVLARDGLRLRVGGELRTFASGWELLQQFDDNLDRKIDDADRVWSMIDLFMDANADGQLVNPELHRPETGLRCFEVSGGPPYIDPAGNTRSDASFTNLSGVQGLMTDVQFTDRATDTPAAAAALPVLRLRAHPNPFNPQLAVQFEVTRSVELEISIYDARGHRVGVLANRVYPPGSHREVWAGLDATGQTVASGVYFLLLQAEGMSATHKVSLVR